MWGGETQEGGIYFYIADSHCCTAKGNKTIPKQLSSNKNKQTKKARQQGFSCFVSVVKQ